MCYSLEDFHLSWGFMVDFVGIWALEAADVSVW